MVTNSRGESRYRGLTLGIRKRFSQRLSARRQLRAAKDEDDDSNERDPFTDRSFNFFDLSKDWGPSDRDIRHKFNFVRLLRAARTGFRLNARVQTRGAQPITAEPAHPERRSTAAATASGRTTSSSRSTGALARPFRFGGSYEITPIIEMFNTFNNANNINPLSTPALFNFDGFLRTGVGDPRQVQLAVKVTF